MRTGCFHFVGACFLMHAAEAMNWSMLIPAPSHGQCCRETASAIIKSNPTTPTKGAGAYHNGARVAKAPPLPLNNQKY
jgi:hypothetical protein